MKTVHSQTNAAIIGSTSESHILNYCLITRLRPQSVENGISFDEGQQEGPFAKRLLEIFEGLLFIATRGTDPRASVISICGLWSPQALREKSFDAKFNASASTSCKAISFCAASSSPAAFSNSVAQIADWLPTFINRAVMRTRSRTRKTVPSSTASTFNLRPALIESSLKLSKIMIALVGRTFSSRMLLRRVIKMSAMPKPICSVSYQLKLP